MDNIKDYLNYPEIFLNPDILSIIFQNFDPMTIQDRGFFRFILENISGIDDTIIGQVCQARIVDCNKKYKCLVISRLTIYREPDTYLMMMRVKFRYTLSLLYPITENKPFDTEDKLEKVDKFISTSFCQGDYGYTFFKSYREFFGKSVLWNLSDPVISIICEKFQQCIYVKDPDQMYIIIYSDDLLKTKTLHKREPTGDIYTLTEFYNINSAMRDKIWRKVWMKNNRYFREENEAIEEYDCDGKIIIAYTPSFY